MKVHIATARSVGHRCCLWASNNLPAGAELTPNADESDVFISVMHDKLVDERFINEQGPCGDKRRCYNFHPGILPGYRGSGAFSWAIINGEQECGITLHEMDVDIDHGPIISMLRWKIKLDDTAESLFRTGMESIEIMFRNWFAVLVPGDCRGGAQDESKAHLYYRRDLQQARDLTRFARAFAFEGKAPAFYLNRHGVKVEIEW